MPAGDDDRHFCILFAFLLKKKVEKRLGVHWHHITQLGRSKIPIGDKINKVRYVLH